MIFLNNHVYGSSTHQDRGLRVRELTHRVLITGKLVTRDFLMSQYLVEYAYGKRRLAESVSR